MVKRGNKRNGVDIKARFSVRDFFLLLSMLGCGGNLLQCWHHSNQIQELQKQSKIEMEKKQNEPDTKRTVFTAATRQQQ